MDSLLVPWSSRIWPTTAKVSGAGMFRFIYDSNLAADSDVDV